MRTHYRLLIEPEVQHVASLGVKGGTGQQEGFSDCVTHMHGGARSPPLAKLPCECRPSTDIRTAILECEVLGEGPGEQKRLPSCPVMVDITVDPGIGQ